MREERVALEHGVDVAPVRRDADGVDAADEDLALVRLLEAGHEPKRSGLAATGRPEQGEELALADLEVDRIDRRDRTEALRRVAELDVDIGVYVR